MKVQNPSLLRSPMDPTGSVKGTHGNAELKKNSRGTLPLKGTGHLKRPDNLNSLCMKEILLIWGGVKRGYLGDLFAPFFFVCWGELFGALDFGKLYMKS